MTIYNTQFEDEGYSVLANAVGFTLANGAGSMFPTVGSPAIKRLYAAVSASGLSGAFFSHDASAADSGRATFDMITCFAVDDMTTENGYMLARWVTPHDSSVFLLIGKGGSFLQIYERGGSPAASTLLANMSQTYTAGKKYFARFAGSGTLLKGRVWDSDLGHDYEYGSTLALSLPGTASNYASTPDSAANSITGDIDFRVKVAPDDWTPATYQTLMNKGGNAGTFAFLFRLEISSGRLFLFTSPDGTALVSATATVAVPGVMDGVSTWVRVTRDVDNGAAGNTTKFYYSTDYNADTLSGTWTQIGADVTNAGVTSIFNSSAIVEVGTKTTGLQEFLSGKIYRAQMFNGIAGTLVAEFNPDARTTAGATSFVSATGETWTINQSGGTPAALVAVENWDIYAATTITAAGKFGVGCYHSTLTDKIFPVNFLSIGTGGDAAIPNRTNAEFTEFLRAQDQRRIFLAEFGFTRYDASGGASSPSVYNPTGKIYISKGGFTSKSYDTPANQPYRDCIKKVPTFSKKMGPLLTGKAEVSFGAMDVDNPIDDSIRRQNLLLRSEQFDHSAWTKTGTTNVTANNTTAPDGTMTADKMTQLIASGTIYQEASNTPINVGTQTVTARVCVKAGTSLALGVYLKFYGAGTTQYAYGLFVFSTGTLSPAEFGASVVQATSLAIGNGWYEIIISATGSDARNSRVSLTIEEGVVSSPGSYYGWRAQIFVNEPGISEKYVQTIASTIDETVNPSTAGIRDYWTRLLIETNDYLLLMGGDGWPRFDFRPIIRGRIGDCTTPDARTLRFPIRGMDDILSGDLNPTVISTGPNTGLRYPRFFGSTGTADYYPQYEATQLDDATYEYLIDEYANTSEPEIVVFEDGLHFGFGLDTGATISAVNTGTGTITSTYAAQLAVDSRVMWTIDPPLGLTINQYYFVITAGKTSTEFRVSATRGGAAITGGSAITTGLFVGKNYWMDYSGPSTFTLTVAPVGRITFTHYAEYPTDTRAVIYSVPYSLSRMLENIIFWKMGASLNYLDLVSFDAMYTAGASESEAISIYTGSRGVTAAKIVGDLLAGNSAWCIQDASGYWRAGYLNVPTATATRNIGGSEIDPDGILLESTIRKVDFSKVQFSYAPWNLFGGPLQGADQVAINGKQFLTPYSYGTPAIPLDNFPSFAYADEVKTFESQRGTLTSAGTHRTRLVSVFKKKSGIFRMPASAAAIEWAIGDIAQIDHDRFDWKNFSATNPSSPDNTESFDARKALVVGIDADPDSDAQFGNVVRLWRPMPAIFPADEILENPT